MKDNASRFILTGIAIMLASLLLDQASKHWLVAMLMETPAQFITITPFFNLAMVWNRGISFGMFSEHDQPLILIAMTSLICVVLFVWLVKARSMFVAISLGLVLGGAVGNIIDRVNYGAVADFFDFHLLGYHWPAFNVADGSIFIGVVLLCIHSMFMEPKQK